MKAVILHVRLQTMHSFITIPVVFVDFYAFVDSLLYIRSLFILYKCRFTCTIMYFI